MPLHRSLIILCLAVWLCFSLFAQSKSKSDIDSRQRASPSTAGHIFLGSDQPCKFPTGGPSLPLTPKIPGDFHSDRKGAERSLENLQCDFDVYSWETFIALNWPAKKNGVADTSIKIGENLDHATVWESWKQVPEVFLASGEQPKPWGSPPEIPAYWTSREQKGEVQKIGKHFDIVSAVDDENYLFLTKIAKGHEWFQTEQPFNTGPLIDQNGQFARFELLMNETMFQYIVDNKLYSREGQQAFKEDVVFPCGNFKENVDGTVEVADGRPVTENVGSVVVKAAWKVLSPTEAASGHFHVRKAIVCTPDDPNILGKESDRSTEHSQHQLLQPTCSVRTMGLVGFHIVHKSQDVPEWNWSTFEQVDNVPTLGHEHERASYNFYSPQHPELPINAVPPRPWDPRTTVIDPKKRSQIVRTIPISRATQELNAEYQKRLRSASPKSVWQYYELVSTQWPTRPAVSKRTDPHYCNSKRLSPVDTLGGAAPVFLGNATLESYIQGTVPNTSSSCMDCHANATTTTGAFSDFTYVLDRAGPQPKEQINNGHK